MTGLRPLACRHQRKVPTLLKDAIPTALRGNDQALFALDGLLTQTNGSLFIALAAKHRLSDMYGAREHPEEEG